MFTENIINTVVNDAAKQRRLFPFKLLTASLSSKLIVNTVTIVLSFVIRCLHSYTN